ncbi:MAG: N-terminal phage integrase SAM-like domain-containing protein [Acidimicrobiia bacterium]|nr:N-terminal phage integrase SAM-like domain-containing protein [Acidimicrobiia bacterium]
MTRQRRTGGGIDRLPSGKYRVRIVTLDGRRRSLGAFPTKRAAEAAYARAVVDHAEGRPLVPAASTTPTLDEYAPSWVDARLTSRGDPLRPRVRDLYATQLRLHILPALGSARLAKLTPTRVREWYAELRGADGPGASATASATASYERSSRRPSRTA